MKIVLDSPEHHFLTTLEGVKAKSDNWFVFAFEISKKVSHQKIISDSRQIHKRLTQIKDYSQGILDQFVGQTKDYNRKGLIYQFQDNDIIALVQIEDPREQKVFKGVFDGLSQEVGSGFCSLGRLSDQLYHYQKIADQKLLTALRYEGYEAMCDQNKISSIAVRRERRENPCVLVVEDDRFTASYASNILSGEYDIHVCQNGEEAIKAYIERAPDVVFLDIHLPGLNGHETLEAIKAVDTRAFVVMLSVDAAKDNIVTAAHAGAYNFLKKPFSKERLLGAVKKSPYVKSLYVNSEVENLH